MAASLAFFLTGGASNSNGNASLGGAHSSYTLSATAMNNLFDNVSSAGASAGVVDYRAVDITNTGDASAVSVSFYMNPETSSPGTQIDAGIEASPTGSTTVVTDKATAPAGVTFSHYNSGTKLTLPDIAAGAYCRVWLKRSVTAGAVATSSDSGALNVEFA